MTSYITPEEKNLFQKLPKKLTPRSSSKFARQLGRKEGKVKEWQKCHSPEVFQQKIRLPLFSEHLKVKVNGKILKNKFRGCSSTCNSTDELLQCQSCEVWYWHLSVSCLQADFEARNVEIPPISVYIRNGGVYIALEYFLTLRWFNYQLFHEWHRKP